MIRLVKRKEASQLMVLLAPLLAVVLTVIAGLILFALIGKEPARAMYIIFIQPLTSLFGLTELTLKATPMILIGLGLSFGFRAGVWNIGAEGQFAVGAVTGSAAALALHGESGLWVLPLISLAGIAGGMAWGSIPALLKTRFNTNEILSSLMLVYVGVLLLSILVHGPLRDPQGFNFPVSKLFSSSALLPIIISNTRANVGFLIALAMVVACFIFLERHTGGYALKVFGAAPRAARYAGFQFNTIVWGSFLFTGGLAGLAGTLEVTGPVGQLVPGVPSGYGFTAIIVAFLGRLHPIGVLLGAFLIALAYIGGEAAQIAMSLPRATTSVFQAMLLFFVLATDVLARYRVRVKLPTTQPKQHNPIDQT